MEKEQQEEEAGIQRFVNYIRKQGLVIVEASQLANPKEKFNKENGKAVESMERSSILNKRPMAGEDDSSVVTVYRNAVNVLTQGNDVSAQSKRDSSSSDKPLDTSDEFDKIPVGGLSINGTMNKEVSVAQFISDIRSQQETVGK